MKIKVSAKLRKEIARRKLAWEKAKPAQRRVMVAQDVLDSIEARQIVPGTGCWVRTSDITAGDNESLQVASLSGRGNCECCAMGGLMLSIVRFTNKVTVADGYEKLQLATILAGEQKDRVGITKLFHKKQIALIELAFEGGSGFYRANKDGPTSLDAMGMSIFEYQCAMDFYRHRSEQGDESRMVDIMKNIVANKGKFCPDV